MHTTRHATHTHSERERERERERRPSQRLQLPCAGNNAPLLRMFMLHVLELSHSDGRGRRHYTMLYATKYIEHDLQTLLPTPASLGTVGAAGLNVWKTVAANPAVHTPARPNVHVAIRNLLDNTCARQEWHAPPHRRNVNGITVTHARVIRSLNRSLYTTNYTTRLHNPTATRRRSARACWHL